MKVDVSVIIVNYHCAEMVIDCINSIFEKTKDITYNIIVVDNASCDGSVEKLKKICDDRVCVIASEENLGFGKANNLGNQYAKGEYVFLLNPDTILVNNAIKILHDALLEDPDCGVVGGNLYMPDMSPSPSYCLRFDDLDSERRSASWRNLIGGKFREKIGLNKSAPFQDEFNRTGQPIQVAYVYGADMMMKKSLFDQVGGFDPDFFMYYEEEELIWRITNAGYKIMSIPEAEIIHLDGASIKVQNTFSERQFRMRMNGAMTYYRKRFGSEGVHSFFQYRKLRYERLIKIAEVQHKLTDDFLPAVQKKCLEEEYVDYKSKM